MVKKVPLEYCYVVVCYQNVVGLYANDDDARQVQRDFINKNRPADVLCRPIVYPKNYDDGKEC